MKPSKNLSAYDVVKIQLEALKNNNKNDDGIKVTWLFAHPDNKKVTGPYERFRIMIYGQQYKYEKPIHACQILSACLGDSHQKRHHHKLNFR